MRDRSRNFFDLHETIGSFFRNKRISMRKPFFSCYLNYWGFRESKKKLKRVRVKLWGKNNYCRFTYLKCMGSRIRFCRTTGSFKVSFKFIFNRLRMWYFLPLRSEPNKLYAISCVIERKQSTIVVFNLMKWKIQKNKARSLFTLISIKLI